MSRFPYHFFDEYVVRTPLFSYKKFRQKIFSSEISEKELSKIYSDPFFLEAIYLASPELYYELHHWIFEKKKNLNDNKKLKRSLLKYYIRMSTRCTPFGLFAGVGLGRFDNTVNFEGSGNRNVIRDTKLDMHLLVSISKTLETKKSIKEELLYFPNNSIYSVGRRIRYIEYENIGGKREYIISSAENSKELSQVLEFSAEGKTLTQIARRLSQVDVSYETAKEFIEELTHHQLLISELEPNVSGQDYLDTIINILKRIGAEKELQILIDIKKKLEQLDVNIGNSVTVYLEIEDLIRALQTNYEKKYLFQTDLYYDEEFILTSQWKKDIKKALSIFNKITPITQYSRFNQFKDAFRKRFEMQEVPLSNVLDSEIGIGYHQNSTQGVHHYLEDLSISNYEGSKNYNIVLNEFQKLLNEKLQNAILDREYIIDLNDKNLEGFAENWEDLPGTLSVTTEIVSEDKIEKLYIGNAGGSSAANLLARFCSNQSKFKELTRKIVSKEENLNKDYILAEIIHLPESRIGNIIRRPTLRNYEIPYLAQSVLPTAKQISVDDLLIAVRNNKIILRSKRLNKEIKPYLTNAHNYHHNSLPVYNFLCDLQLQNLRPGINFNWGGLSTIYKFLPRVEYNNIILSKAQWNISIDDVDFFNSSDNSKHYVLKEVKAWRDKRQIPQWVQLVQSDNVLVLNLQNYDMVLIFIQILQKEKQITIEEFLYNENDDFKREFVFTLFKN